MIGTPYYFSPEMCKGESYDLRSDIWSLGILLYEMCCLDYPFRGKSINSLINKITAGKFDDVPAIYGNFMNQIIRGLLKKDPERRPTLNQIF